jgi:hypothetical protein
MEAGVKINENTLWTLKETKSLNTICDFFSSVPAHVPNGILTDLQNTIPSRGFLPPNYDNL